MWPDLLIRQALGVAWVCPRCEFGCTDRAIKGVGPESPNLENSESCAVVFIDRQTADPSAVLPFHRVCSGLGLVGILACRLRKPGRS